MMGLGSTSMLGTSQDYPSKTSDESSIHGPSWVPSMDPYRVYRDLKYGPYFGCGL